MDSEQQLLSLINEANLKIKQYRKDINSLKKEIANLETECIGQNLYKEGYEERLRILRLRKGLMPNGTEE